MKAWKEYEKTKRRLLLLLMIAATLAVVLAAEWLCALAGAPALPGDTTAFWEAEDSEETFTPLDRSWEIF